MLEGVPLIGLPRPGLSRSSMLLKRALDLVIAGTALLLLGPALLVIALLVKLDSPGPVLFRQLRTGKEEKRFVIFKFRTRASPCPYRSEFDVLAGSSNRFSLRVNRS
jgi:polysaccharide biosynthesis protein PslA